MKIKLLKFIMLGLVTSISLNCKNIETQKVLETQKPNVIIILSDDQGYGDLSCHGNPHLKTPNLDKLYKESVRLTDFHTSAICTPTRSQLLTGIDAVRNGAYNYGYGKSTIFDSIPEVDGSSKQIHLMSEYFKENGYATGHFGKWHLGDNYPFRSMDRGFDETLTFPSASVWQSSNYWNNDCFDDYFYRNGKLEKTQGYCNDLWFNETMDFIGKAKQKDQPFFVYLPTSSMHTPLFVPEKYSKPYKGLSELTEQYFGMVANFDENYGVLDSYLEQNGLKENTILIYLSDNGGAFGIKLFNAGMQGGKGSIFEGGHREPCFIRWPKGLPDSGKEIDDLTMVQDILPTLIDLCQLKSPWEQNFDGLNIAAKIKGEKQDLTRRMSVVQFSTRPRGLNKYVVLWNKWRYLQGSGLYNIESDPGQKNDIVAKHPEIANKMQIYYDEWYQSVQPSLNKKTKIDVGYEHFNNLELTCFDWLDMDGAGNPSQQYDIRQGMNMHGYWNLNFKKAGTYKFVARRWPKEADAGIAAGLPYYITEYAKQAGNTTIPSIEEHHNWGDLSTNGIYPIGKALKISKARFTIDGHNILKPITLHDKSVEFECEMPTGTAQLKIDFLNSNDQIECGAYYVEIAQVK